MKTYSVDEFSIQLEWRCPYHIEGDENQSFIHSVFSDLCLTCLSVYDILSSCAAAVPGSVKSQRRDVRAPQNLFRSFLAKCFCGSDKHIHSPDVKNIFFSTRHFLTVEEAIQKQFGCPKSPRFFQNSAVAVSSRRMSTCEICREPVRHFMQNTVFWNRSAQNSVQLYDRRIYLDIFQL